MTREKQFVQRALARGTMHSIPNQPEDAALYHKVNWRVLPLLFTCYLISHIDRNNLGYAQLEMKTDLGFSDSVFGIGASSFFIGYFLFEVPSNLLLERVGARKTLLRIMFLWGIASAGTMLVQSPAQFYAARLLLGVFEAGFLPGVLLYLTFWYPAARRARAFSVIILGAVVAHVVTGPLCAVLMKHLDGLLGFQGWQWMFLVLGLPSCALGVLAFVLLSDSPRDAPWLSEAERHRLTSAIAAERTRESGHSHSLGEVVRNPRIYLFALMFFFQLCAAYALSFWLPTLVRSFGVSDLMHVGLYSAIPGASGALTMIAVSWSSDWLRERRFHYVVTVSIGAAGLVLATSPADSPPILALILMGVGTGSAPVFWAIPPMFLSKSAAAAGIAFINSMSVIAGALSPYGVGLLKERTGSLNPGLYVVATGLLIAAVLMLVFGPRRESAAQAAVIHS